MQIQIPSFLKKNPFPVDAIRATAAYLRRHPTELLRVARNAAGLRATIPLDALRWLAERNPKGPKDVELTAVPPALRLAASTELMGNPLRAGADVTIDDLHFTPDELRISLRLANLKLQALGAQDSPMAALFKSMDLSNPSTLIGFMPAKPAAIVESKGDKLVLDLLKVPKIAANTLVRRLLEILSPVLVISGIKTEGDHLVVAFRLRREGLTAALAALRG